MDAMNFPQAKVEVSTKPIKRQGVTYMTVSELADELDVHRNSVIYWIKTGKVNAVRIGLAEKSPFYIPMPEVERIKEEFASSE